jgi:FlaA1/EpsC-like NDP-sugar epimerase
MQAKRAASRRRAETKTGELAGQVALVTGAAGEGIGKATARKLLELGAAVAVTDSHERRTKETAEALAAEFGARVVGFPLDVGNRDQIAHVCDAAEASLGPIDILVNNAAINVLVPVSEYSQEDWDRARAPTRRRRPRSTRSRGASPWRAAPSACARTRWRPASSSPAS